MILYSYNPLLSLIAPPNFGDNSQNITQAGNINDFMVGIPVNTKRWAHALRAGFNPAQRVDLTETVLFSSAQRIQSGTFIYTTFVIRADYHIPNCIICQIYVSFLCF